jgi:hypothetical protein
MFWLFGKMNSRRWPQQEEEEEECRQERKQEQIY